MTKSEQSRGIRNNNPGNPWFFVQIQLLPEYQRKGLGEKLLCQTLDEARTANVGVKLTVLKANPAKHLYERAGFRLVGEEEHHFLMQWPNEPI